PRPCCAAGRSAGPKTVIQFSPSRRLLERIGDGLMPDQAVKRLAFQFLDGTVVDEMSVADEAIDVRFRGMLARLPELPPLARHLGDLDLTGARDAGEHAAELQDRCRLVRKANVVSDNAKPGIELGLSTELPG